MSTSPYSPPCRWFINAKYPAFIVRIHSPPCRWFINTTVTESDDSGKIVYDETFECQSNAGYDNFSIVYS